MSSAMVSTSAALGRLFVFDEEAVLDARPHANSRELAVAYESAVARLSQSSIKNQQSRITLTPASRLEIRPAPEMVSSGIPTLDTLTGGLPRGCLTEICGPASSGRTSLLLTALAAATRRGEFCAVVDASDALDPHSAAAAGVDLDRLLWVRCGDALPGRHRDTEKQANQKDGKEGIAGSNPTEHRLEQVLRATDLLLESGGFGLIVLDLADLPVQAARRIPLTTWFRFRRTVEYKPTILLAIEQRPIAGSCSSLLLQLGPSKSKQCGIVPAGLIPISYCDPGFTPWANECRRFTVEENTAYNAPNDSRSAHPSHAHLLTGLNINAELICSRLERKPARSVKFATKTAWAG